MVKGIRNRNNKGFSLIELVIVIAVLSILGAIAIPYFDSLRKKAMIAAVKENITKIVEECLIQNILVNPSEYGLPYKTAFKWNNANTSFSDNGGIDLGSPGYPYYFHDSGFNNPLSFNGNCLSITSRSEYFKNTTIGKLPHFNIGFNAGTMHFEKLCFVDDPERTFNNGTCDTPRWINGESKRVMW